MPGKKKQKKKDTVAERARNSVSAIAIAGALVVSPQALAQPADSAEQIQTRDVITVTAQKREQSVDDVGMSIDAFSGDQLRERGVSGPRDLIKLVPGFTYTRSQFDQPTYTIRGVGYYESSLSAGPTVSVYVDQVPLPYPSMTRGAILDLERVEVLKGPQGTLFGQNSTGGAINYIAAKPTDELEAGLRLSYGRFGTFEGEGFISGPLSDNLLARLAVKTEQSGDWQQSTTRDDSLGSRDFTTARLILDFEPSQSLRFQFNANGWLDRSDTQAPQVIETTPVNPLLMLDPRVANSIIADPDARDADWNAGEDFSRDNEFFQLSLRGDYDISDDILFTSISSYQHFDQFAFQEVDGTPARNLHIIPRGEVESFSQELRLSGAANGDKLNWLIGGNFQDDKIEDNQQIFLGESTGAFVGPLSFDNFFNISENKIRTWAVFANAEYQLMDALSVQGGVRYTDAKTSFESCTADSGAGDLATIFGFIQSLAMFPGPAPLPGDCITLLPDFSTGQVVDELNEDNVAWRAGLNWKPFNNGTLLYANVSQGYKAGSFPTLSASNSGQLDPVTQEKLLAYEVGFKAPLADHAAQLNGAVFYYDYTDKQLRGRVQDPIFGQLEKLVNIPNSEVWGGEIQVLWAPIEGLRLSANASYVATEILANDDGSDFMNFPQRFGPEISLTGNEFPYSPNWQLSADAQYEWSLTSNVDAFFGASVVYQSDAKSGLEDANPDRPLIQDPSPAYNDPALVIDAYALIDLRAGLRSPDDRWELSVWGKNIANEYYWVNVLKTQDTLNRYSGEPATFGVTASLRY